MDTREKTAAANALIEWFNSQEISQPDAMAVMSKVMAKIFVASMIESVKSPHTPEVHRIFDAAVDRVHLQFIHDVNDRLYHVRQRR
jgi:hypothetical protein